MDLLMRLNERLSETEQALEKALQEKHGDSTSQPLEVTPMATTTPPTVITTVPSIVPPSTAGATSTATTPSSSTAMTIEHLIKAMEELKLQVSKLKQGKEKLAKIEQSYDKSKMTVAEKTREVNALENKARTLEKDLSLHKPLEEIRGILWTNIIQSLTGVWRSIQTIYE